MAEFEDIERKLIEGTKSGKPSWRVQMDGPFWITSRGNLNFTVARDASVRVWGSIPYTHIGVSQTLVHVLDEYRPMETEVSRDEVLKRA